jgi:hypothetical protein
MADSKISALPTATSVAGSDVLPIVQSAATKQVSFTNVFKSPPALGTTTPAAVKATTLAATADFTMANGTSLLSGVDTVLYVDANYTVLRGKATNGILFQDSTGAGVGQFTPTTNDFKVNTGNIVQGTAAKGVNFTANTPAAGMTSQLLNAYEEGTWTPNQGAGLTVVGAFTSSGTYTKIGRSVTVNAILFGATSILVTTNGIITSNLPFTQATGQATGVCLDAARASSTLIIASGVNIFGSAATSAASYIFFSITYMV